MKYLVLSVVLFALFFGCSSNNIDIDESKVECSEIVKIEKIVKLKEPLKIEENSSSPEIVDLIKIPQDVSVFTQHLVESKKLLSTQKNYKDLYYSPWNITKPKKTLQDIEWPFASFKVGDSYGENLLLLKEEFFSKMRENYNFSRYLSINKKAITLKYANMRALPTDKPIFRDPSQAGEGFPFDYLQNSTIAANKPLFVSHYSKDKKWVMVFSSFTYGWMKVDEIVFLNNYRVKKYQKAEQVFLTKENIPIYSQKGDFLFNSRIGMVLALISENRDTYTVLTISAHNKSTPLYLKSIISKDIASKNVLQFNQKNMEVIINEIQPTKYGWGGIYEQRDCSSMIRDIYMPFGIWLPRNSSHQRDVGEIISLDGLSDEEKIKLIKVKAVAFETILYKKGHVVLYVGTYENEVIVFHDYWGVKTKKDGVAGRIIIGKPIFSTLKLGSKQKDYDEESELLRNMTSMNIFTNSVK